MNEHENFCKSLNPKNYGENPNGDTRYIPTEVDGKPNQFGNGSEDKGDEPLV